MSGTVMWVPATMLPHPPMEGVVARGHSGHLALYHGEQHRIVASHSLRPQSFRGPEGESPEGPKGNSLAALEAH